MFNPFKAHSHDLGLTHAFDVDNCVSHFSHCNCLQWMHLSNTIRYCDEPLATTSGLCCKAIAAVKYMCDTKYEELSCKIL